MMLQDAPPLGAKSRRHRLLDVLGTVVAVLALPAGLAIWHAHEAPKPSEATQLAIVEDAGAARRLVLEGGEHDPGVTRDFVSTAQIGDSKYLAVADYSRLYCFDTGADALRVVAPPPGLANAGNSIQWMPTGVFYSRSLDRLYIANYLGNDILEGSIDCARGAFSLISKIQSAQTGGPENVALSADGGLLAAANYNSGMVTVFRQASGKWSPAWQADVPQAHGVVVLGNDIFVTSLTKRTILKFSESGVLVAQIGSLGSKAVAAQMMWPTSLTAYHDNVIMSDAHSGYVCGLDSGKLKFLWCAGGYGPGADRFNMPYGVSVFDDDLMVASTFSSRITELHPDVSSGKLAVSRDWFLTGDKQVNQGYVAIRGYARSPQSISYDPYTTTCSLPAWLNRYKCRYGGFVRSDENKMLTLPSGVFVGHADGYFYFSEPVLIADEDSLIVVSPQSSTALYLRFAKDVPVVMDYSLGTPGFVQGDQVVSTVATTSIGSLRQNFDAMVVSMENKRTSQAVLLPADAAPMLMGPANASAFPARLAAIYGSSPAEHRFVQEYMSCSETQCKADELRESAISIAKAELAAEHVDLDKVMVACMLVDAQCNDLIMKAAE